MSDQLFSIDEAFSIPFQFDILKAETGSDPSDRRMGGILTTNRRDREGQVVVAAQNGTLNTKPYEEFGRWNDNHERVIDGVKVSITVGYPYMLQFRPGVGYYTEGRLLPNVEGGDLAVRRANYYWGLAIAMKAGGFDRSLGLSIEGNINQISPCKTKIYQATIHSAAVCEVPMNPDCKLSMLSKSFSKDRCECHECNLFTAINKSVSAMDSEAARNLIPEDLEGTTARVNGEVWKKLQETIVKMMATIKGCGEKEASEYFLEKLHQNESNEKVETETDQLIKRIKNLRGF